MLLVLIHLLVFSLAWCKGARSEEIKISECEYDFYPNTTTRFHGRSREGSQSRQSWEEAKTECDDDDRCQAIFVSSSSNNTSSINIITWEITWLQSSADNSSNVWIKTCNRTKFFRPIEEPFAPVYYEPVSSDTNESFLHTLFRETPLKKSSSFTRRQTLKNKNQKRIKLGSLEITVDYVELPRNLFTEDYLSSWCMGGKCKITPRTYFHPVSKTISLVGFTDDQDKGHILFLNENKEIFKRFSPVTIGGDSGAIAGLYGFHDGRFAVGLYIRENKSRKLILQLHRSDYSVQWEVEMNSAISEPDREVGDFRLTHGQGYFAVYFTVYGVANFANGTNGEQLSYVNEQGVVMPTSFQIPGQRHVKSGDMWGCSHSLGQLVKYHEAEKQFITICTSDLFPRGISIGDFSHGTILYDAYGNGKGSTSAQLGQIAQRNYGWNLVFSASNKDCCEGRGIGFLTIYNEIDETTGLQSFDKVNWLTDTNGVAERDPVIAKIYKNSLSDNYKEHYLVGWYNKRYNKYYAGIVDKFGDFEEGPSPISGKQCLQKNCVKWGNRDDSFHTSLDGSVQWISATPKSNYIALQRVSTLAIEQYEGLGLWTSWSMCSRSCNGGVKTRRRYYYQANVTASDRNGEIETDECNAEECQVPMACSYTKILNVAIKGDLYVNGERQYSFSEEEAQRKCTFYRYVCTGFISQKMTNFMFYFLKTSNETVDSPGTTSSLVNCVENRGWSQWSTWHACSVVCGGGRKSRYRYCDGGDVGTPICEGPTEENTWCNNRTCAYWGEWTPWTKCSATCGKGRSSRERACQGDYLDGCEELKGNKIETKLCNLGVCPSWAGWGLWGQCSRTCGNDGKRIRTRQCFGDFESFCINRTQIGDCPNMAMCPIWHQWSQWTPCTATCDIGIQTRRRSCANKNVTACYSIKNETVVNEETKVGFDSASNLFKETSTRECSYGKCSFWSVWGQWSACSNSCNEGKQTRTRSCNGDFNNCVGSNHEIKECTFGSCGYWGKWSSWGTCSSSCGSGKWRRTRKCFGYFKQMCNGDSLEIVDCNVADCIEPCLVKPCQNDGQCRSNNFLASRYYCECTLGWAGRHCDYSSPRLNCDPDNISVSINEGQLRTEYLISNPKYIALSGKTDQPNCRASDVRSEDGSYVISVPSPFRSSCGSKYEVSHDSLRIGNTVQWKASHGAIVSRVILLNFTCIYMNNVSTSTIKSKNIKPLSVTVFKKKLIVMTQQGHYQVHIKLFRDRLYKREMSAGFGKALMQLAEGQLIYIKVESKQNDQTGTPNENVLVLDTCFVTSSANMVGERDHLQMPFLHLIRKSCPVNNFVDVISNGDSLESKFSVRVFGWKQSEYDMEKLYIHCKVKMCDPTMEDCVQRCEKKYKRSLNNISKKVPTSFKETTRTTPGGKYVHIEQTVEYPLGGFPHENDDEVDSNTVSFGPISLVTLPPI